ncbi:hypothetical protein SPRG_06115 [Saprolegnia parasitica CBS 223.65]|uniref:SCP2 domain-containing protein n=1 Tax=Saprolegnia parasitica (strain CBS 223.65) TaxID=695850 RepID=A0A067CIP9_SAPPC|nr:hypothetical protein SPRG_06115 [Saprolegnia parasitica CBS 223.65]KDO29060.1 hypothetical protein SPRG_06115 [Saprolegnia parasitica CBS 223.65]|eukprot:XP_012200230.1 hypothetical protein SPRG_06115 [Saprolegnia parasitica CBS 223.65]
MADVKDIPRADEIAEVMDFLKFSIKGSSGFLGNICFNFRVEGADEDTRLRYIVHVNAKKEVKTTLLRTDVPQHANMKIDCEVTMTIDDFLHLYSGKATIGEVSRLCYSGRVHVSGFQFRFLTRFAQSFEFSTDKWNAFYAWQRDQQQQILDEASLMADSVEYNRLPRQIALYIRGGVNMAILQRRCFEASLSRIFGTRLLLSYTSLAHSGKQFQHPPRAKKLLRISRTLNGVHPPTRKANGKANVKSLRDEVEGVLASSYTLLADEDLLLAPNSIDDEMVKVLQGTARYPLRRKKGNWITKLKQSTDLHKRVDLTDATRKQIDKIMANLIGPDQPMTKSNFMPAPQRVLHELKNLISTSQHEPASPPLSSVLRDMDAAIAMELGLVEKKQAFVRPAPPVEIGTRDIIRYNTNREFIKGKKALKKKIEGLRQGLLTHRPVEAVPDSMAFLIDY